MTDLFGIFGRSQELQRLDRTLRGAGLDPRGVAEAVKLTILKEIRGANFGRYPELPGYESAAALIAYCLLGPEAFAQSNGAEQTEEIESRIDVALATGYGLDARLVLLTLYARVTHPDVVQRYNLTAE